MTLDTLWSLVIVFCLSGLLVIYIADYYGYKPKAFREKLFINCPPLGRLMKKLKRAAEKSNKQHFIEKKVVRILFLVAAAHSGANLWDFLHGTVRCIFSNGGHITSWVEIFILSHMVLIVLWWFRTYDTRQQIEKAKEQIQQGNFVSGLNKLIKQDSFSISIGVQLLIQVSKKTNGFDEDIRLAFIKRMQKLPKPMHSSKNSSSGYSIFQPKLNYLPHIFKWILRHAENHGKDMDKESIDVPEMDFGIAELKSTSKFVNNKRLPKNIPLIEIKKMMDDYHDITHG